MSNCASDHFRWIGTMADRIICSKSQANEFPLLSLSFLSQKDKIFDFFSQFSRPTFPITVDKLTDSKLYGVVVSAVAQDKKKLISNDSVQYLFNFELILNRLLNEGYVPQNPCELTGLTAGRLEDHVNLCKSIEFLVADKSLDINVLKTDLLYVPHSFYVPNEDTKLILIEDAISLWLSKFHCIAAFQEEASKNIRGNCVQMNDKNYRIQMDASKFAKIAGCLSRAFPDKIDRDEIMNGEDEDEIQYNIKISKNILDEIHAFVVEKFPTDEHLFTLFISDLFYATRKGVKKFVPVDHSVLYQPHPPAGSKRMKSPRGLSNKINLNHYMSGTIEALERRKESEEYNMLDANYEEKYKITPYSTLQTIKDREELNVAEANYEEKYKITPYSTLQTIKDHEELNVAEANYEEKYKITPYNTLQTIKDREELNMADAKIEERGRITPYSTLQTIKDHEELNMADAREEESGKITPYSTLQTIKDREELSMSNAKAEEGIKITPYSTLQNIKDREESNMADAKEEEKYNITPYNTLQDIKDHEELNVSDAREEENSKLTPYGTLQNIKDREESNVSDAREEENSKLTPYGTLQNIKDSEESNMSDAKEEEKYNITPYNTLQDIKDREESNVSDAKEEENSKLTPYGTLQNIKDREESNMVDAREEESSKITPYNTLQNIKDREESKVSDAKEEEKYNITPYNTLQDIKDEEEGKLQNAENESKFNDLLKVPSSNLQKNKNPKIVRPSIEPKSSKNSIGHKTREINNQNFDSSSAEKLNEQKSFNSLNQDQIDDENNSILSNNETVQVSDNINNDESTNDDQLNQYGSNFSSKSNGSFDAPGNDDDDVLDENEIIADNNNENSEKVNDEITTPSNDESEFSNKEIPIENNKNENNNQTDVKDQIINRSESNNDQIQNENENNIISNNETNDINESNNETNDEISTINSDDNNTNTDTLQTINNKENEIEKLKSEDEEMTEEMIVREEEKYRFHLKLKQLMSNSQTLTTNTVPNYQTIANALRFNSLPGPKYSKLLDSIIETIKDFKDERIVLLMDSRTQKFKGIYILTDDGSMAEKLWGKGPNNVQNDDVSILYKYLDGQKSFDVISSKSFTQTTDGFSLVTKLEHESW